MAQKSLILKNEALSQSRRQNNAVVKPSFCNSRRQSRRQLTLYLNFRETVFYILIPILRGLFYIIPTRVLYVSNQQELENLKKLFFPNF